MDYYHRFGSFMHEPSKGESLRHFVEKDCYLRAKKLEINIQGMEEKDSFLVNPDYELVKAMPVNFITTISNYSVKKHGADAPPIAFERLGQKLVVDDDYSFFGTFGNFLVKISATQYDWIGELEYPSWEICPPDLIAYDNYDYQLDEPEVD